MRLILVVAAAFAASALAMRGQGGADSDIEIKITEGTQMAAVASPDRRSIAIDLLGAIWVVPFDGGEAKRRRFAVDREPIDIARIEPRTAVKIAHGHAIGAVVFDLEPEGGVVAGGAEALFRRGRGLP